MKKVLLIVLALSLFSCNEENVTDPDSEKVYYEVNKNDTFEVSLNSNPTTGYSWKWINENSELVEKVSADYIPTEVEKAIIGSGGTEIWKFKGTKIGIDTLTLEYCRPWETNSTVETKKIIVKIK
jgi:inhibitor of cysteine peptidase